MKNQEPNQADRKSLEDQQQNNKTNPLHSLLFNYIQANKQNFVQNAEDYQSSDIDSSNYPNEFEEHSQAQSSSFSGSGSGRGYWQKFPLKSKSKADQNMEELKKILKFKERTRLAFADAQAMQKQIKIDVCNIPTYFPYQPYPLQVTYMKRVIEALQNSCNALLESPTGTGKTLCLLSSALSWAYAQKLQGRHRKIIYLSRTHSQLMQTQKQLKKTCFRPTMSHVASRDYLCIKPELKELKGMQRLQGCTKGVALRRKQLKGLIRWQKMSEEQKQQTMKTKCNYYQQKSSTVSIGTSLFANQPMEMEEFISKGHGHGFCPYYYPYHMDQYCDLFFMPYNYILNIDLLPRFSKMIEHSILIFDEAHNVPEASCEGRSFQLIHHSFQAAESELHRVRFSRNPSKELQKIRKMYMSDIKEILKQFGDIKQKIFQFLKTIKYQRCPSIPQKIYSGQQNEVIKVFSTQSMHLALYQLLNGRILDESIRYVFNSKGDYFQNCLKGAIRSISQNCTKIDSLNEALKQAEQSTCKNVEKISTFYKRLVSFILDSIDSKQNFIDKQSNHFRLIVKIKTNPLKRYADDRSEIINYSIQLRCLVPWLTFEQINEYNPRSMIFTSGTLSPLQSWENQLNISAPIKLVNTHVISERQVSMNIVTKNIMGSPFDFRFKTISQNSFDAYSELVQTIFQISKNVPHGMLVICPNFKTLKQIKNLVEKQSLWKKMNSVKSQVFEEKGSENYIEQFKQLSEEGAILYCVCRGRASEGIDFPDHHCRAVIFVGVPFPNISDPIIIERKEHFEKMHKFKKISNVNNAKCGLNWEKWYFNGTIRAINQGLGRLIRHAKDYGMLFLLDQRYSQSRFQDALPRWTQKSISIWRQFTTNKIQGIQKFYYENASRFGIQPNNLKRQSLQPTHKEQKTIQKLQASSTKPVVPLKKLQVSKEKEGGSKNVVNKQSKLTFFFKKVEKSVS